MVVWKFNNLYKADAEYDALMMMESEEFKNLFNKED